MRSAMRSNRASTPSVRRAFRSRVRPRAHSSLPRQALRRLPQTSYRTRHRPGQQDRHQSDVIIDPIPAGCHAARKTLSARRQHQHQRVALPIQRQRLPDDTIRQQTVDPPMRRGGPPRIALSSGGPPAECLHPRMPSEISWPDGSKTESPDVLRAPEFFHVFVGGVLPPLR